MYKHKDEVITFKVDPTLAEALRRIPNRSQFIRSAVLASLDHMCPLCQGSGILTPDQKGHWEDFAKSHMLKECDSCGSVHLVCNSRSPRSRSSDLELHRQHETT